MLILHTKRMKCPFCCSTLNRVEEIKESGVFHRWQVKWWPRQVYCPYRDMVTEVKLVSIIDVQGAYYILAICSVLAGVVLCIELVMGKQRQAVKKRSTESTIQKNIVVQDTKINVAIIHDHITDLQNGTVVAPPYEDITIMDYGFKDLKRI